MQRLVEHFDPVPHRRVMDALAQVPRHAFVPPELQPLAYADRPLPSGCGKISSLEDAQAC